MTNTGYDLVTKIMMYEQGELNYEDILELFQVLVDTGKVWSLQGHYVTEALALINMNLVEYTPETGEEND